MQNLINRLGKRGWAKHEIDNVVSLIHKAKQNKTHETLFLEKRILWLMLAIIITTNITISVSLVPILMFLTGAALYFFTIVIGVVFGFLFEVVIRSIEHLEYKHHIALAIFIPATSLITALIVTNVSNSLMKILRITNVHNSLVIGIVYAISFSLPYLICKFVLKKEYYLLD